MAVTATIAQRVTFDEMMWIITSDVDACRLSTKINGGDVESMHVTILFDTKRAPIYGTFSREETEKLIKAFNPNFDFGKRRNAELQLDR